MAFELDPFDFGNNLYDDYEVPDLSMPTFEDMFGGDDSGIGSIFDDSIFDYEVPDLSLDAAIEDLLSGEEPFDLRDPADYSWLDALPPPAADPEDDWQGPFGWGVIPGIRAVFFGSGEGPLGGNVLEGGGILGQILGFGGAGGAGAGGAGAAGGGQGGEGGEAGIGGLLSGLGGGNPLLSFLAMKSLLKDEPKGVVPVGEQAYGQAQPFNYQDYQPTNLQPALMPGVGYANVGAPGMQSGGEVGEPTKWDILTAIQNDQVIDLGDGSIAVNINGQYETISAERMAEIKDHSNKSGIIVGSGSAAPFVNSNLATILDRMAEDSYEGMQSGGTVRPGDVTFAKLEPGEFVIQKPAVDAVGIETLEQINNMGNGRPYYG